MNKKNLPAIGVLLTCFIILMYFSFANEFPEGGADNYWHYWFSKYAFAYPQFFLSHWAKPVFVLLSAPFSQFGFAGIKLFNILCGILSAAICYRFCNDIGLKQSRLVIPILIFCPVYFTELPTALTEPLFGLLLIVSSYLFFHDKFFWGAVTASFLLFSRTEGMFMVVYFSFYLLLAKEWKSIPFLATAFIIYAFAGLFSGHDFLWYFTENPYKAESPYGHGEWNHFLKLYPEIFGVPHVFLLLPGIIFLVVTAVRNNELNIFKRIDTNSKVILLVFFPALLFFLFHAFSWATGKFGSAGLHRVMASIIPCTAIVCIYTVQRISKSSVAILFALFFIVSYPFNLYEFPLKARWEEKAVQEAAAWFKQNRKDDRLIYFSHPGIIFYCGLNPFDKTHNIECFDYKTECDVEKEKPFYYFWDSSFSEFACHNPVQSLENCPGMKRIKEFEADGYRLYVYEFMPEK